MRCKDASNRYQNNHAPLAVIVVALLFCASCNDGQSIPAAAKTGLQPAQPRCALALGDLFTECPTSGTCTMSAPDELGRVAHCYGDGSKDVMALTDEGIDIHVFDRQQRLCYRVKSGSPAGEFHILGKKGEALATVNKAAGGELVAQCDGVTFNLNDYRSKESLNVLNSCVTGVCTLPPDTHR